MLKPSAGLGWPSPIRRSASKVKPATTRPLSKSSNKTQPLKPLERATGVEPQVDVAKVSCRYPSPLTPLTGPLVVLPIGPAPPLDFQLALPVAVLAVPFQRVPPKLRTEVGSVLKSYVAWPP